MKKIQRNSKYKEDEQEKDKALKLQTTKLSVI